MRADLKELDHSGVRRRFLSEHERLVSVTSVAAPLVIEPVNSNSTKALAQFLRDNSSALKHDVARHGAVLLRGFEINTIADFENQIVGIRGIQGISKVLLSEPGRTVVDGTRFVLYTNALVKTGGTLAFTAFHSENYYVADVPRFIFFFCVQPPRLGGETGLLNTATLYAELPDSLKAKLEAQAFWVSTTPLVVLRRRYGCLRRDVEEFCAEAGLPIVDYPGPKAVVIHKPSVIVHPITRERCLAINFGELDGYGMQQALLRAFSSDYSGLRWLIHRNYWRLPPGPKNFAAIVRSLMANPTLAWPRLRRFLRYSLQKRPVQTPITPSPYLRVGDIFSEEDIEIMAQLIRRHYSSFIWRRGDILMVDNLKMAHAGMPGLGARELKVIISNRVNIPCSQGSGIFSAEDGVDGETLGSRILEFSTASSDGRNGPIPYSA
jgi:alpha-ketoglutarate-dependent taurine dioxygenase